MRDEHAGGTRGMEAGEALLRMVAELGCASACQLSHILEPGTHSGPVAAVREALASGDLLEVEQDEGHTAPLLTLSEQGWGRYPSVRAQRRVARVPAAERTRRKDARARAWAALARAGFRVGRCHAALLALRRVLSGRGLAPEAVDILLPPPFSCAVCARCGAQTCEEGTFTACAACGAAVSPVELVDPFRCTHCRALREGCPPAREHAVEADVPGAPGGPCPGDWVPAPYLSFDLAHRSAVGGGPPDVVLLLLDDPGRSVIELVQEMPLRLPVRPALPVLVWGLDTAEGGCYREALLEAVDRAPGAVRLEPSTFPSPPAAGATQ